MHKLYLFNNTQDNQRFDVCYSITDKGHVLGQHVCSNSSFMKHDLHDREDRLEKIKTHFNNEPYELIVVPDNEVGTHPGLAEAYRLNQEMENKKIRKNHERI